MCVLGRGRRLRRVRVCGRARWRARTGVRAALDGLCFQRVERWCRSWCGSAKKRCGATNRRCFPSARLLKMPSSPANPQRHSKMSPLASYEGRGSSRLSCAARRRDAGTGSSRRVSAASSGLLCRAAFSFSVGDLSPGGGEVRGSWQDGASFFSLSFVAPHAGGPRGSLGLAGAGRVRGESTTLPSTFHAFLLRPNPLLRYLSRLVFFCFNPFFFFGFPATFR